MKSQSDSLMFLKTQQSALVQKFIPESKGGDLRIFVVDQKVVGAMKRQAQEGEFRSNLHRGGYSYLVKLTSAEEEAAIKSSQVLNIPVAGVDILQSNDGPMVIEVNASPGLEGIEGTTHFDIAREIIKFIENNI